MTLMINASQVTEQFEKAGYIADTKPVNIQVVSDIKKNVTMDHVSAGWSVQKLQVL